MPKGQEKPPWGVWSLRRRDGLHIALVPVEESCPQFLKTQEDRLTRAGPLFCLFS